MSVYHRNGLGTGEGRNNGVMRLVAKRPGRVVVRLRARITAPIPAAEQFQLDRDRVFENQVESLWHVVNVQCTKTLSFLPA